MHQALTVYLLVHLTNSTTLIGYIQRYSTRRFRKFLLFTSSEDPLLSYPTHCRRAAVSRTPVLSISRPTARTPSRHCSSNDVVSSNYPVQLTAYENCTTIGLSLPRSLLVYFGREVRTTATPCRSVPPSDRISFPSKAAEDASGLRAAQSSCTARSKCRQTRDHGVCTISSPPFMRYSAINLLICSTE